MFLLFWGGGRGGGGRRLTSGNQGGEREGIGRPPYLKKCETKKIETGPSMSPLRSAPCHLTR